MIDVISKNIQYMTAEVGYCYGSKYWGKGYASEALRKSNVNIYMRKAFQL